MDMDNQIVVYKASDGNELAVKTDGETVWMTIEQMVKLLGRDRTVLVRHINNAIKEGELRRDINVQNLHNIQSGRGRPELVYDLDTMISVGYRVKSPEGVRFRRWYPPRKRGSRFVASQAERKRVPSDEGVA